MRRILVLIFATLVTVFAVGGIFASVADAHSGNVTGSEDCQRWQVDVSLNRDVTSDRSVDVISTIPGTTGLSGRSFNTSYGSIWSASGTAPATGTVTLQIWHGDKLEFHDSTSIEPSVDCPTPTTTSTSTVPQTTTTAAPPCQIPEGCGTTTTSLPVTTTTLFHVHCVNPAGQPFDYYPKDSQTRVCPVNPPTTVPSGTPSLPVTGGASVPLTILGIALVGGGIALAVSTRKRRG